MEITHEPFESVGRDKEHRWQQIRAEVDQITDALGKPVDAGIKETVVAFRALGLNTSGSCEGHMDWAGAAPYVDIDPPQSGTLATLEREMFEAQTRAMNTETEHITAEEYGRLWDAYHEKRIERKRTVANEGRKLLPFSRTFTKIDTYHSTDA